MSTYLGTSKNEVGDIRRNKWVYDDDTQSYSYTSIPIKAIFKNEKLIWPIMSKYKFWISEDPNDMEYQEKASYTIHVKAGWQKTENSLPTSEPHPITIYVKSCSRSGRIKCPFHVDSLSDWVTIQNTTDTSVDIDPNDQVDDIPSDAKYDGFFTIYIKNNTKFTDRGTRLRVYQIDPATGLPTRNNNLIYITIIQDADEQYSNADFSNGVAAATWYEDGNFSTPCTEYGDSVGNGSDVTNGTTDVFVQITGKSYMWSGTQNMVYFGNNGEYLDSKSFLSSGYIYNAYNISYVGNGKWKATIKWEDNPASDATKKNTINNLKLSPKSEVNWGGNSVDVVFDLNVTGTAFSRKIPVTLQIPASTNWTGNATLEKSVYCWQNGGTVQTPIVGANPSVTPDISADGKWVNRSDVGMTSVDNTYSETFIISASELVEKSRIEDEQILINRQQVYYIGANDTEATVIFKIMHNNEVYEERICTFTVKYLEVTDKINLTQTGEDIGNYYEITRYTNPEIINNNLLNINIATDEDVFITSHSTPYYNQDYWRIDLTFSKNEKKIIEPAIRLLSYPVYVTSDIHDSTTNPVYIEWQVVSGEVNAEARENILSVTCPSIQLDDEIDMIQQGTADAVSSIYHDTERCVLTNNTDGTTWTVTSANTSTHTYRTALIISKNNDNEGVVVMTKPTTIEQWSQDVLNNDITSCVYVQVKGYPAYQGIDRYVNIGISVTICEKPASCDILQEKKDYVLDLDNEKGCNDLTQDDFILTDDSEAEFNQFNPITYTGNGWYTLLLDVDKNTQPDSYECHILLNNVDLVNNGFSYDVHEYLKEVKLPLSAWWSSAGTLIKRKATINVAKIDDINLTWPEVPYTGEAYSHVTYTTDWVITQTSGSTWVSYDTKTGLLTVSKNKTMEKRTATFTINFYDNYTKILEDYTIYINQDPIQSIEDLGYVIKSNTNEVILYEVDNKAEQKSILIESHDGEWSSCDVEIEGADGLTIKKTIVENYGVKLNIYSTSHLYDVPYKEWNLVLKQLSTDSLSYTGKTITVNVQQASYSLSVYLVNYGTSAVLDSKSDPVTLEVTSTVTTKTGSVWSPVSISSNDYSWLEIGEESTNNATTKSYECKITHINDKSSTLIANLAIVQSATKKTKYVYISNKNWRASEFDESWIELYYPTTIEKNFWSVVDNTTVPMENHRVIWDKNTIDPSWVHSSLSTDEEKSYKLVIENDVILVGTIPYTDVVRVNNSVYGIGSCRVTKHAFEWSCSSEVPGENVMYISAYANTLWSMYYIKSTMDGLDIDFDILGSPSGMVLTKSGNSLMMLPTTNNIYDTRKQYVLNIRQKMSNQTMRITIYQLTKKEEAEYEIYNL